jgi:hypothetical protein
MLSIPKALEEEKIYSAARVYLWCSNVTWKSEVSAYEFAGSNLGRYKTDFAVTSFCARKGYPEYSGMLDSVWTCCHVVRTSCKNFPNKCRLKSNSVWTLEKLDLASEWCCLDVWTSSTLKLLDTAGRLDAFKAPSRRLHRNRLADFEFTWNLHRHLLETCDKAHGLKYTLSI